MMRRVFGVLFFSAFFIAGVWMAGDWFTFLFGANQRFIAIDGFASIWACMVMIFFGSVMAFVFVFTKREWIEKNVHVIVIATGFVFAPIVAGIVMYGLHAKAQGFVECEDLRQSSRRHSSKTYAITPLECQRLVSEREARRS